MRLVSRTSALGKVASLALATLLGLVAVAAPAGADSIARYDNVGDVRSVDVEDDSPVPESVAEPARVVGDISRMKASHETTIVRVSVHYKALPKPGIYNVHTLRFKTASRERLVYISVLSRDPAGTSMMLQANGDEDGAFCPGLEHRIEYSKSRMIVTVPRKCLGFPGAVRVGAKTATVAIVDGRDRYFYDDANVAGGEFRDGPVLGPSLRR